ncbi:MAG: winged helix-turn-helix domain-containing protein [Kangiellaceae bacterium]|nr:winged helix-turn-helix domain-containing protein [Kangiellaceae bacterium]
MSSENFVIGDWLVKPAGNLLINKDMECRVEPKIMALLVFLANADGKVLSRDQLLDNIWNQVVLGDTLTNTIAQLRKALGDSTSPKKYIETIPKQGYRLIPQVEWLPEGSDRNNHSTIESTDSLIESRATKRIRQQSFTNKKAKRNLNLTKFAVFLTVILVTFLVFKFDFLPKYSAIDVSSNNNIRTVAVLPFDVYSKQEDIQFFAGGLTEELIHQLAADPDLRVIARTSSSKFEGTNTGIKEISKILNARFIIEGSIRQSGENLRTTVQLIDANKGFHLWSKTFDNKVGDLFLDTQIAIGEKVSSLITNKEFRGKNIPKRNHPRSAEAYRYFILAQSHMKIGNVASFEKAIDYYQKSTNIAPEYALAYTGIAAAKLLLSQYKHTSARQAQMEASDLLGKAFSLEPQLPEAYAVRGLLYTYSREFELAEQDYLKAIQLNPGLRFARHNYAYMLSLVFRTKEAITQNRISLEIDPLSHRTNFGIGNSLIEVGEIEEGIKQFESCLEILPQHSICYLGLATVYGLLADQKKYLHFLQESKKRSSSNSFWLQSTEAKYELQLGNMKKTRVLIEKASRKNKFFYHLLKTELHMQLKTNELETFKQKLTSLAIENPNTLESKFLLGHTSYLLSDCKLSIIQYETARKNNIRAFLTVWDWAEGISHQLNLAYCYQQSNNIELASKLVQEYKEYIEQLPASNIVIPGKIYNQARYYVLMNELKKAQEELDKIQDWPLLWLATRDPILSTLVQN